MKYTYCCDWTIITTTTTTMVSQLFPFPLVMSVVTTVVTGQDRMPTMDHTLDLMSYTCGEVTQAKQFNFVSPGQSRLKCSQRY